jgi:8-oxo-dGTP pyrophosphatase MutT (NUDIX family)
MTGDGEWVYAREHRQQVLAEFERQRATKPGYFNGPIQIMLSHRIEHDTLFGEFATSDFASFVYWRAQGLVDDSVRDCFGCAIVRSAEGHLLLGVQAAGNLNAGRAYFPSGFIDPGDLLVDGTIDIDRSVVREIEEETELDAAALTRTPGYIVAAAAASIAIGVEYRSGLSSVDLRAAVLANLARQAEPELADIVMVGRRADLDGRPTTPHVQPLLVALL